MTKHRQCELQKTAADKIFQTFAAVAINIPEDDRHEAVGNIVSWLTLKYPSLAELLFADVDIRERYDATAKAVEALKMLGTEVLVDDVMAQQ